MAGSIRPGEDYQIVWNGAEHVIVWNNNDPLATGSIFNIGVDPVSAEEEMLLQLYGNQSIQKRVITNNTLLRR